MKPVKLYTTFSCAYCVAAKTFLSRKGVPYEEIDVSGDHDKRTWLAETTGQRTVPQIFIGEQSIGGYRELKDLEIAGQLDALLAKMG